MRDGGATGNEWIGTWNARTAHAAGEGRARVGGRHVRSVKGTHRGTRASGLRLESLVWHTLWWHPLLGHTLWWHPLLGHTLWRHPLLGHLAVSRLHHALRWKALLGHALWWNALLRHALRRKPLAWLLLRKTAHRRATDVGGSDRRLAWHTGGSAALTSAAFRTKHGVIRNGFPARRALHGATSSHVRRLAP